MQLDTQRKVSFEENFAALDQVVESLEKGELTLDEAIAMFEKGMRLAKACNDQLETAELKIVQLRTGYGGLSSDEVD